MNNQDSSVTFSASFLTFSYTLYGLNPPQKSLTTITKFLRTTDPIVQTASLTINIVHKNPRFSPFSMLATANHPQGTGVPEPRVITAVVAQGDWVRDVVVQIGSVTFSDDVMLGNMTVIVEKGQMARVWAEGGMVVQ